MSIKTLLAAALALGLSAAAGLAAEIRIDDPYFRTSGMMAHTGAAFFTIENESDTPDRLIGARSDVAKKVELHTHIAGEGGVMKMRPVEFIEVPAHGSHALRRGGDHVMFMGLTRKVKDGDMIELTLIFEKAGEITLKVPVDLKRDMGASMNMGGSDGAMKMDGASQQGGN